MRKRCSIQQGEKDNCWLEQSPEKSTVSTVQFLLGHPVYARKKSKKKRHQIEIHQMLQIQSWLQCCWRWSFIIFIMLPACTTAKGNLILHHISRVIIIISALYTTAKKSVYSLLCWSYYNIFIFIFLFIGI